MKKQLLALTIGAIVATPMAQASFLDVVKADGSPAERMTDPRGMANVAARDNFRKGLFTDMLASNPGLVTQMCNKYQNYITACRAFWTKEHETTANIAGAHGFCCGLANSSSEVTNEQGQVVSSWRALFAPILYGAQTFEALVTAAGLPKYLLLCENEILNVLKTELQLDSSNPENHGIYVDYSFMNKYCSNLKPQCEELIAFAGCSPAYMPVGYKEWLAAGGK